MRKMIILAAGEGSRLRPYTSDRPKCMVELKGKTILDWQIEVAAQAGITDIVVVKGYYQEKIQRTDIRYFINEDYNSTNMVETLWCAEEALEEEIIISYGDIIYEKDVLDAVLMKDKPIAVAVDKGWRRYWEKRFDDPLADAESLRVDGQGRLLNIGQKVKDINEIQGQYIGLLRFQKQGIETLKTVYHRLKQECESGSSLKCGRPFKKMYMTDLLQSIIDYGYEIYEAPIERKWLEIDSPPDYEMAQDLVQPSNGILRIIG